MNTRKDNATDILSGQKAPVIISIFLLVLVLGSLLFLLLPRREETDYIADIYQNGTLLTSIPLYEQTDSYSFEITGDNGCSNTVEVRPGSIAIISADCPDQICVHQGAVSNSLLPITCLPNGIVIQLRAVETTERGNTDSITPDIISY